MSYDFVSAATHDGRTLRLLTLIDEYSRECLAMRVARRLESYEVVETLAEVMFERGVLEHLCSDNGPEFVHPRTAEVTDPARNIDAIHQTERPVGEWLSRGAYWVP